MVSGPLRVVLWALGAVGMLWVIVWLIALSTMGGMMSGGDMMGGAPQGSMMGGGAMGGGTMAMIGGGGMLLQVVGMLGLAGIFVYLVVDSLRGRSASGRGGGPDGERGPA